MLSKRMIKHETFDWFAFNGSIISKHLTGKRKAIAINPSYIPKSGKKTPQIGYFWSGCAGEHKRGLEIMGIGVIDMYSNYLISRKDKIQSISRTVVADAFFSMDGREVRIISETDSSWNFALEMASSMQQSPTVSQPTLESWIFTSMRRLQPSTWQKRHVRG